MQSKTLKLIGTTVLVSAGFAGAALLSTPINAASSAGPTELIQKLAEKFGIDQTQLTQFFADEREARQDARLDNLVTEGTITQAQRDALEVKQDEQQAKRAEIEEAEMTSAERREALEALRTEMQTWLNEQGIELPRNGDREFGGPGRHRGMLGL